MAVNKDLRYIPPLVCDVYRSPCLNFPVLTTTVSHMPDKVCIGIGNLSIMHYFIVGISIVLARSFLVYKVVFHNVS